MNKYVSLAIGIVLVVSIFLVFSGNGEEANPDQIGIVSNVKASEKGYTFIMTTENQSFKCFYYEKPDEAAYAFKGSFSDDGNMFFISEMKKL